MLLLATRNIRTQDTDPPNRVKGCPRQFALFDHRHSSSISTPMRSYIADLRGDRQLQSPRSCPKFELRCR
jgi:hypothetical protein